MSMNWKVTGVEIDPSSKVREVLTYSSNKVPGVKVLSRKMAQPHANGEGEWFYKEYVIVFPDTKIVCHTRKQAFEMAEKSIYSLVKKEEDKK